MVCSRSAPPREERQVQVLAPKGGMLSINQSPVSIGSRLRRADAVGGAAEERGGFRDAEARIRPLTAVRQQPFAPELLDHPLARVSAFTGAQRIRMDFGRASPLVEASSLHRRGSSFRQSRRRESHSRRSRARGAAPVGPTRATIAVGPDRGGLQERRREPGGEATIRRDGLIFRASTARFGVLLPTPVEPSWKIFW